MTPAPPAALPGVRLDELPIAETELEPPYWVRPGRCGVNTDLDPLFFSEIAAREVHLPQARHWPGCGKPLTLANQLRQLCPHCSQHTHGQGLDVGVPPQRALDILIELGARRDRLGLPISSESTPTGAGGFDCEG